MSAKNRGSRPPLQPLPAFHFHSVGCIENNYKVLVYHGWGLRGVNKIKYTKCNKCEFQKKILDLQIAICVDKHLKKWKNMLTVTIKKHLTMKLLVGRLGSLNGTIG